MQYLLFSAWVIPLTKFFALALIKSISGIRGTIGGKPGDNLTPIDIVKFASAYGEMLRAEHPAKKLRVVIGRDARLSGGVLTQLVSASLQSLGIDVTDLGLSTTPTVELAVPALKADGGIILTASHNPAQWNALKLLNGKGEFLSAAAGEEIIRLADAMNFEFADVNDLGEYHTDATWIDRHIEACLAYPLVNVAAIRAANFTIAVDAVNSSGGIAVPALLEALGVQNVVKLYCEPTGKFPHNPEPLPEHLGDLSAAVVDHSCHLGITVDPDVDRLAFVCEDGSTFGEEYTLVAVADYVLGLRKGSAVSNLSSTRALRDVAEKHGGTYHASAVGEVNVVAKMKEVNAVIGGEGNGGIIVPDFHYGRDALIGIALFLSHLALSKKSMRALRDSYPNYAISKQKIDLPKGSDVDGLLDQLAATHSHEAVNRIDGVKIDFPEGWVHLRKSNTEPIIRIYAEHLQATEARRLADSLREEIEALIS